MDLVVPCAGNRTMEAFCWRVASACCVSGRFSAWKEMGGGETEREREKEWEREKQEMGRGRGECPSYQALRRLSFSGSHVSVMDWWGLWVSVCVWVAKWWRRGGGGGGNLNDSERNWVKKRQRGGQDAWSGVNLKMTAKEILRLRATREGRVILWRLCYFAPRWDSSNFQRSNCQMPWALNTVCVNITVSSGCNILIWEESLLKREKNNVHKKGERKQRKHQTSFVLLEVKL